MRKLLYILPLILLASCHSQKQTVLRPLELDLPEFNPTQVDYLSALWFSPDSLHLNGKDASWLVFNSDGSVELKSHQNDEKLGDFRVWESVCDGDTARFMTIFSDTFSIEIKYKLIPPDTMVMILPDRQKVSYITMGVGDNYPVRIELCDSLMMKLDGCWVRDTLINSSLLSPIGDTLIFDRSNRILKLKLPNSTIAKNFRFTIFRRYFGVMPNDSKLAVDIGGEPYFRITCRLENDSTLRLGGSWRSRLIFKKIN